MTVYIIEYFLKSGDRMAVASKSYKNNDQGMIMPKDFLTKQEWSRFKEQYHRPVAWAFGAIVNSEVVTSTLVDFVELKDA